MTEGDKHRYDTIMLLLQTASLEYRKCFDSDIPKYAILPIDGATIRSASRISNEVIRRRMQATQKSKHCARLPNEAAMIGAGWRPAVLTRRATQSYQFDVSVVRASWSMLCTSHRREVESKHTSILWEVHK